MYYPYLRGRQNELLGLQELLDAGRLSKKIVPVVEPVRFNSTFINTLKKFIDCEHPIILIRNPKVGKFYVEYEEAKKKNKDKQEVLKEYEEILYSEDIGNAYLLDSYVVEKILENETEEKENVYLINTNKGNYQYYEDYGEDLRVKASFIPNGDMDFKDVVEGECIGLDDSYKKKKKNADYMNEPDEFFSKNHLTFQKRGYQGYSDYTIVGNEYEESGFAPLAIAIHIVYLGRKNALNIHHFVSDSNYDFKDPARKFEEAMSKLMNWEGLDMIRGTKGVEGLINYYENEKFPGLGVIKKYSIMHHLELIGNFLEGQ